VNEDEYTKKAKRKAKNITQLHSTHKRSIGVQTSSLLILLPERTNKAIVSFLLLSLTF